MDKWEDMLIIVLFGKNVKQLYKVTKNYKAKNTT